MLPALFMKHRFVLLALAALAVILPSCTATRGTTGRYSTTFTPNVTPVSNPGAVRVKISTSAQRVYVMEGSRVLLASPCSVGTASDPTPSGNFTILSKKFDRRRQSSPGARYPMTYWMSFHSAAYGMHWGFVKPYPCTHGCVRLPIRTAKAMFEMVSVGTPVQVARTQPEDATAGAALPVLDDSQMPDPPNSYMLSPQVFTDARNGKLYHF
jgi:lipoprotein-anchoring transpeptidase ErfK/SrfK